MSPQLPLSGIKVIDYSHFLAGPFMSRTLAALGADVIKIERPTTGDAGRASPTQRDGVSGYFLQQNMGKRGLCLDLRQPKAMELMRRLVTKADVFVENYRPGALKRLGLGYDALSAENPRLVYCSVSAFGHTGPLSDRPGFGLIAEAMSGAMSIIGEPGKAPPLFRMPLADMYTGIHGTAAIVESPVKKAALWSKLVEAWFPQGVDDPDLALVQVRIVHASYWDVHENKLVQFYKMAKAAFTGVPPTDLGEHAEIRMG